MKLYLTRIVCLLPFLLSACTHKDKAANQPPLAPPIEDAPLSKPSTAPKNLPPSVVTNPAPQPAATTDTTQNQTPPKPAPKHKKPKPAPTPAVTTTSTQTASADKPADSAKSGAPITTQEASNGTSEVSAIGQLSSGEPGDLRSQTVKMLTSTEHSLNNLNRKLSDQEEKTVAQIHEYIKQAHTALDSNDLDGAHTLATKAKLLLNELTQ